MLSIKNNMMAENAARNLGTSYDALAKSVQRLSSGLRINSARDDAAGLAVRELIRADVAQLRQASRNAQDAVSMLQTAEGAMAVMDDILVRMKELAEQAATGSYSTEQRTIMDSEYTQLATEITRIATSTTFNGTSLLDGVTASVSFHIGSGSITFTTDNMQATQIANNASLQSSAATTVSAVHADRYVASADNMYILDAEIAAAGTRDIILDFGVDVDIAFNVATSYDAGITLNQLVMELNAAASTAGWTAPVAFAEYNSTYDAYFLKLQGETAGVLNTLNIGTDAAGTTGNELAIFSDNADLNITAGADAGAIDLTTTGGAEGALDAVTIAITTKDTYRATLGYYMNRLDAATSVLNIQAENLMAAESRISDVDVATEMAAMTRNQVLSQAGISMLAQANSMPQMALKLLG